MRYLTHTTVTAIAAMTIAGCQKQPEEEKMTGDRLDEIAETFGQFAPDDAWEDGFAYYGSENEFSRRQFTEASADRLYKRRGQRQMLEILDGHPDNAIAFAKSRLAADAADAESYFILTVAYSVKGDIENALSAMARALDNGMDFSRFLAGPRDLLQNLYASQAFQSVADARGLKLVHGPMVGGVSSKRALFWTRTLAEDVVSVACFDPNGNKVGEGQAKSHPDADYTCVVEIQGLKPDTEYRYEVSVNGALVASESEQTFNTFAEKGSPTKVTIGVGGCAGYTPIHERIWSTLASHKFDAMLMTGDNVYIDIPEMPGDYHDYSYYRRQSQQDWRAFVKSTPIYAIWDDHDAATDDIWMGPYRDKPDWKQPMVNVFNRNWVNPGAGTPEWPGCWFGFSLGDVDVFMLDGRTYRTNPHKAEKTMLGAVQKQWLFDELKASDARVKLIVSPVAFASDAKPGSRDTWNGFLDERQELYDHLSDNEIGGVVLVSGDRHRTDLWRNEREGDYPLYEIMSCRLTNVHTHDTMPGSLYAYNEKCSFGTIEIDTTLSRPTLVFNGYSIDNEKVFTHRLQLDEISY